jgi:CHAT domain-containing protein
MSKTAFIRVVIPLLALLSVVEVIDAARSRVHYPKQEGQQSDQKAQGLFQQALLHRSLSQEKSRPLINEAVQIWTQSHQPDKVARALIQLGQSYMRENQYLISLGFCKQALVVKSIPSALRDEIASEAYLTIAQVYDSLYSDSLAVEYFNRTIESAQRSHDRSIEAHALMGLADLYLMKGDHRRALTFVMRARLLKRQEGDDAGEAELLRLSGQILSEESRQEPALESFSRALTLYRRTGDAGGQIKTLCLISNLLLKGSKIKEALLLANEAVDLGNRLLNAAKTETARENPARSLADDTRARDLLWRALHALAQAERANCNPAAASNLYFLARSHAEGSWWLSKTSTETLAIGSRQESSTLYGDYIDFLFERGRSDEAFRCADLFKAQAIRSMTVARRSSHQSEQSRAVTDLEQKLSDARAKMLTARTRQERAALQKEIHDAENSLDEERLVAEVERSPDRVTWSKSLRINSLQQMMARDKSALLEFSLGETRSFVWCITPDGFWCEVLPSQQTIEKALKSYLAHLAVPPNPLTAESDIAKVQAQSKILSAMLFGKLADRLSGGQKLVIVPDGILHYLPFETLLSDGRYLIADHEISYVASASMLGLWTANEPAETKREMELLAFGNPSFESLPLARPAGGRGVRNQFADMSQSPDRFERTPLPRTRDEVEYLASLFPSDRSRVYVGKESTEDALKRESLRAYKRLHFATHSLIDELNPARSAVMFSSTIGEKEDGVLEAGEIAELDIDCDLVVLSACRTARGKLYSGERIVGLSRAFIRAGARSVAVSLWNVSDITTSRFMKEFYGLMASGVGNAAALRAAKLEMLKHTGEGRHPYYWAPFVLIGKP